jgi:hypothetical protein
MLIDRRIRRMLTSLTACKERVILVSSCAISVTDLDMRDTIFSLACLSHLDFLEAKVSLLPNFRA